MKNLQLGLSSGKNIICKISHFVTFHRNFLFIPWKIFGDFTAAYNTEWNQYHTSISKKALSRAHLKKLHIAKFCILQIFPNTWFSSIRRTLNNFTGILSLNAINITAKFIKTAAIKAFFQKIRAVFMKPEWSSNQNKRKFL